MGEKLVQEEKWDPSVLSQASAELSDDERAKFETMGPITPQEVIDFHYALGELKAEPERVLPDFLLPRTGERQR